MKQTENRIITLEVIGSTNAYALDGLRRGILADNAVVLALAQTQGRGRLGRSFFSPPGQGLYMSYVLPLGEDSRLFSLTTLAGLAVHDALLSACGASGKIKWPNDILIDGKKVCGILTSLLTPPGAARASHAVVGIGVNLLQEKADFPPGIAGTAASLLMLTGKRLEPPALCREITERLDKIFAADAREEIKRIKQLSATLGTVVSVELPDGGRETGRAADIDCEGALILETPNGTKKIFAGTVV